MEKEKVKPVMTAFLLLCGVLLFFLTKDVVEKWSDRDTYSEPIPRGRTLPEAVPFKGEEEWNLNAVVRWDGTYFQIANRDTFDWNTVMFMLNDVRFNGVYNMYGYIAWDIKKGETIKVDARDFFHTESNKELDAKEVEKMFYFSISEGNPHEPTHRYWRGIIMEFK